MPFPVATVAGDLGVSFPVAGLMVYCQIVWLPVTYALVPPGAIVIICGFCPVATVCTGLALSAPVAGLIPNTETVLALARAPAQAACVPWGARHCVPVVM